MTASTKLGLVVIVTGLSGSGKSSALKVLEDNGFLAIDNLPAALLSTLLAIRKESPGDFIKLAVGMDGRDPDLVAQHGAAFDAARSLGYELKVLFLEADDQTLVKRFSETRRSHPLFAAAGNSLKGAILKERADMEPLRKVADQVLDTSTLLARKLKELLELTIVKAGSRNFAVEVLSFGFKNGLPPEADLMFDVRFLPNPFYVASLRNKDGRDEDVRNYVLSFQETTLFLSKLLDILAFLLPLYQREGKSYLTIAVGCTGGQHRSVALAVEIWENIKGICQGPTVLRHRDIT